MNNSQHRFIIPYDGLFIGPLCRIIREETKRYYVSLDHAGASSVIKGTRTKNRRGVSSKRHEDTNLFVLKSQVLVEGPQATVELQQKLAEALTRFEIILHMKCTEERNIEGMVRKWREDVIKIILSGGDASCPKINVLPAGTESERARCLTMAAKVDRAVGPDLQDVADYLRGRGGISVIEVKTS